MDVLCQFGIDLRRGDTKDLAISNLRGEGGAAAVFVGGDVLRFTIKRRFDDPDSMALVQLSSADPIPHVTYVIGGNTGTISIAATDWRIPYLRSDMGAVADLQLTRSADVRTLWAAGIDVFADVTLTA